MDHGPKELESSLMDLFITCHNARFSAWHPSPWVTGFQHIFFVLPVLNTTFCCLMLCCLLQRVFVYIQDLIPLWNDRLAINFTITILYLIQGCSFLIIFGLPGKKDTYECKHAVQCAYKIREKLQVLPDVQVASAGVTTGKLVWC